MADENKTKVTPEGRLTAEALFVKDQYNERSTPKYRLEMIFKKDSPEIEELEDMLADAALAQWGGSADDDYFDGKIGDPLQDGDKYADEKPDKREVYRGHMYLRADTIYNADGDDAPGGVEVFDEVGDRVAIANKSEVYRGCYGEAGVKIHCFTDDNGKKSMKFYLVAFCKTKDGDRLQAKRDSSTLFKREKPADGGRRRRSRG